MSTLFNGNVGYRGLVKLDNTILLATGGQISIAHEPIFSSGVWGAGYQNAASQVAYANNYLKLDGNFSIELTSGLSFAKMKMFAFTNRGASAGTVLSILPNGIHGFTGNAWCSGLSFKAATDGVVTAELSFSSFVDGVNNLITTDEVGDGESDSVVNTTLGASLGALPFNYNGLFPYWNTSMVGFTDIMNWACSYKSDIQMLKCCGTRSVDAQTLYEDAAGAPLAPDYILLGAMTADGSYTVFQLAGDFEAASYHAQKSATFNITSSDNESHTIYLPKIVNSSGSTSIQTGGQFITADFSFTGIGDGANAPMSLDAGGSSSSAS